MKNSLYPTYPVILVDDDPAWLRILEMSLRAEGVTNLRACPQGAAALELAAKEEVELIILDLTLPGERGEAVMETLIKDCPDIPVIIITGSDDVQTAVRCMRAGAFNYFVKAEDKANLIAGVRHAIDIRELRLENDQLRSNFLAGKLKRPDAFSRIVTKSSSMRSIFHYIEAVSLSPEPILIIGESGTGKEIVARAVHEVSGQPGKFVPVNIAALDEHVLDDTLFGHTKGAFTGAGAVRGGLVEEAANGTLFLDEVGDLAPESQVKLLRVLQEREYRPVGSDIPKKAKIRIVAATNRPIEELRDSPKFRKDFFFRLSAHMVTLPPLRERPDDLGPLLDNFLEEAANELKKRKPTPPAELLSLLRTYPFPGNIRELRSMVFDAVSRHKARKLSMEAFEERVLASKRQPVPRNDSNAPVQFGDALPTWKAVSQALLQEALRRADGNQSLAAKMLGMNRQTLNKKLKPK